MKIKSHNFIIFIILIIPCLSAASCDHACGGRKLPFPFGFSVGCGIHLNCSAAGVILAGDFPVESVNAETILVNLPPTCGRPVESLRSLFTASFAPTSHNAILLHDCLSTSSGCLIPTTLLQTNFEQLDCAGAGNATISCYSEPDDATSFIDYRNVTRSGCRSLFSAIAMDAYGNSSSVSLDVQVVRVGWWLRGGCQCSRNAKCVAVSPPRLDDGSPTAAYRCECFEGFAGDGYLDGEGCRKGLRSRRWKGLSVLYKRVIIIGVSIGVAALVVSSIFIWYRRNRRGFRSRDEESKQIVGKFVLNHGSLALKRYTYKEIKKITKSFTEKLGQGGYGVVYQGKLREGDLVAVKVLQETHDNAQDFINEVASISRTSHVNIVNLLGFCFERKKRALVYEFMPNKSLDMYIYKKGSTDAECFLEWNKLYEIAVGVARGLEYLHRGCNTRIVHFDIKPQNILLDEEFVPKISDFGLAKLCKKKQSAISMLGMRGTIGYIAPEVFSRNFGLVSHKSDVYSYGIMLLQMAQARTNIVEVKSFQSSGDYFLEKIYEHILVQNEKVYDEIREDDEEAVRKMLMVGFWCIQTAPSDRPSMNKVVDMLEGNVQSIQIPPLPFLLSSPKSEFSCSLPVIVETRSSSGD